VSADPLAAAIEAAATRPDAPSAPAVRDKYTPARVWGLEDVTADKARTDPFFATALLAKQTLTIADAKLAWARETDDDYAFGDVPGEGKRRAEVRTAGLSPLLQAVNAVLARVVADAQRLAAAGTAAEVVEPVTVTPEVAARCQAMRELAKENRSKYNDLLHTDAEHRRLVLGLDSILTGSFPESRGIAHAKQVPPAQREAAHEQRRAREHVLYAAGKAMTGLQAVVRALVDPDQVKAAGVETRRSQMSLAERSAFIAAKGLPAFQALPR
jgi:hypothetical protein